MKDTMVCDDSLYDAQTGQPVDKSYLESDLPPFLANSIEQMKEAWEKYDAGERNLNWDCDYCNLQSDINIAETGNAITTEQAWYLRTKYLRIERDGELE